MFSTAERLILGRQGLLLLAVALAALSLYLWQVSSWEAYLNKLFAANGPGDGFSISGVVEKISPGMPSITGTWIEKMRVRYNVGPHFPSFIETIPAAERIVKNYRVGDAVPLRIWGDGPEFARVDLPSKKIRCEQEAFAYGLGAIGSVVAACFFGTKWIRTYASLNWPRR